MTRDEILAMPAGRELDYLISEKLFGAKVEVGWERAVDGLDFPAAFSTEIHAAWRIVEKWSGQEGLTCSIRTTGEYEPGTWIVTLEDSSQPPRWARSTGTAKTAPLAICRAALLVVMPEVTV